MGLIEKSMLERWEESKLEAEIDKAPTKPQECCCEPRFRVQPCVPFNQGMPPYKAIEEIRLAIEKNDSSLVSVDALKTIETSIRDLVELYIKTERSLHLAMYFTEEYEKYYETENKKANEVSK